jgi:uncharacterized protein (DUF1499 family)
MAHPKPRAISRRLAALLLSAALAEGVAVEPSRIGDCPPSPNCVSSLAQDEARRIGAIPFDGPPEAAFERLKRALAAEPRTRVVEERQDQWTLRAEAASLLFRFVDDLEFQLDPERKLLHLRSASRVGYWDLGVNRRRAERLRAALGKLGFWR